MPIMKKINDKILQLLWPKVPRISLTMYTFIFSIICLTEGFAQKQPVTKYDKNVFLILGGLLLISVFYRLRKIIKNLKYTEKRPWTVVTFLTGAFALVPPSTAFDTYDDGSTPTGNLINKLIFNIAFFVITIVRVYKAKIVRKRKPDSSLK
jgi:hypothetical protein